MTGLYQASGSAVSLTACVIPCVRFNRFVRLSLHLLTAATLGTSGWLDLLEWDFHPIRDIQLPWRSSVMFIARRVYRFALR